MSLNGHVGFNVCIRTGSAGALAVNFGILYIIILEPQLIKITAYLHISIATL